MSEITPEKTHKLLEKLADYVMTEVSTKAEVNQKIAQVDIIRTEQVAFNHGFNHLEKRVEKLEQTH